jgi:hypothetical protein
MLPPPASSPSEGEKGDDRRKGPAAQAALHCPPPPPAGCEGEHPEQGPDDEGGRFGDRSQQKGVGEAVMVSAKNDDLPPGRVSVRQKLMPPPQAARFCVPLR